MSVPFQGNTLPVLIGSLPLTDPVQATGLVWEFTPEIPLWVQLPKLPGENIIDQFAPGLPGLQHESGRTWVDTASADFEESLLRFYELLLAMAEGQPPLELSPFALSPESARGFFELIQQVPARAKLPPALKGQIVGPLTFGTTLRDQDGKAIFYDPQLRDAAAKLLALRARWQVRRLAALGPQAILFIDDPALTGFGSSMYISITREEVMQALGEIIDAVHAEGGLAGVHICANAEWTLVLDSAADILSFDAYTYFDQLLIYREALLRFLERGGVMAWGIVPTLNVEDLERETTETLFGQWQAKSARITELGVEREKLITQSLITPACGMGALSVELAKKALRLTRELSNRIRNDSETKRPDTR
jgi:methionine synthase II (cobalamin-independent)